MIKGYAMTKLLTMVGLVLGGMSLVAVWFLLGKSHNSTTCSLEEYCAMFEKPITSHQDVYRYFPKTVQEIHDYAQCTQLRVQKAMDKLLKQDKSKASFETVARAVDNMQTWIGETAAAVGVLEMVSPDAAIRDKAHEESVALRAYCVDAFSNKPFYKAFKQYYDGNAKTEKLTAEERYFIDEMMKDLNRQGLGLPQNQLDEINDIKKDLSALGLTFESNIAADNRTFAVTRAELAGVDDHFVDHLARDDQGNYLLACDYPTISEVLGHCTVEATRKKLYKAFNNRAYPQNQEVLGTIIAKRDQLAQKLGFSSFAALDIDDTMVKSADRAETFIRDLAHRATVKADQELALLASNLPEGVTLAAGKFKPWDVSYIKESYKQRNFNFDERKAAEYFEVAHTLNGVFDIYQRFLSLEFKMFKPSWAWHDDVQLIEIHDANTKALCGYIFLDLYPRPNKYSHACHCGIVPTIKVVNADGSVTKTPSVAVVIANFPRATSDRPALLKHRDVETFFHEFGHAMHHVLGSTELAAYSGTSTKIDFVEMPSQMFEEWMFDGPVLKGLSRHYQTGKPLPDDLIKTMLALKQFDSGYFVVRQCWLALTSLCYFKPGAQKDLDRITRTLATEITPQISIDPDVHFQCSFGHLNGYGAKYYSYMWSKVYALDIFENVRKNGLLSASAGAVLTNKILALGGSVDPNKLLRDYLGREPRQDAFLKDIGIRA
jgi:thimet oligopeptidase